MKKNHNIIIIHLEDKCKFFIPDNAYSVIESFSQAWTININEDKMMALAVLNREIPVASEW